MVSEMQPYSFQMAFVKPQLKVKSGGLSFKILVNFQKLFDLCRLIENAEVDFNNC